MDIKDELEYIPETGKFFWKRNRKGVRAGKEAGCLMNKGYLVIRFNKKLHLAHRLAFLLMNGEPPQLQVDHINCNRVDNRWSNLREVTPSQNNQNRERGDIPLGIYEITRKGRKGIWYSTRIQKNGKTWGSSFRTIEKAIKWRLEKEEELFGENRFKKVQ